MKYEISGNIVKITDAEDFDPVKIFECGQCFRWNAGADGVYRGIAFGIPAKVWIENGNVLIKSTSGSGNLWYDYFDMDRDYAAVRNAVSIDDYMREAANFGAGIRILKQDKWETLCSFIISQCNNIPRIKKIVETLSGNFGSPVEFEGETFYTFPDAETVSRLTVEDLSVLHSGYRAPYIIDAAKALSDGSVSLEAIAEMSYWDALKELKKLNGVGEKVANCMILFGLRKLDAFPVDVWMKRALAEHYGQDFSPSVFGAYAGIAQQYIFYHARETAKSQLN